MILGNAPLELDGIETATTRTSSSPLLLRGTCSCCLWPNGSAFVKSEGTGTRNGRRRAEARPGFASIWMRASYGHPVVGYVVLEEYVRREAMALWFGPIELILLRLGW